MYERKGPVQSEHDAYFTRDPLRSYFHEPQKNEIYFLKQLKFPWDL